VQKHNSKKNYEDSLEEKLTLMIKQFHKCSVSVSFRCADSYNGFHEIMKVDNGLFPPSRRPLSVASCRIAVSVKTVSVPAVYTVAAGACARQ